jgi:MFS family permease
MYAGLVVLIRLVGARIPDVLGPRRVATVSLATSAAGLILIGAWPAAAGLFAGTALFSVGQALAFPALMTVAVAATPIAERGAVLGTFSAFVDVAFGLGPVTLGAIAALFGYRGAFVGGGLFAVAGFLMMLSPPMRARADRVLAEREMAVPPGDSEPR